PDRSLARRVAAELTRWNIAIDDSAGQPLSRTPPGAFLALIARAVAEDFAPVPLLALLKHPLAAGGEAPATFRRNVRALEFFHLRGLRPAPGLQGIAERLSRDASAERQRWFRHLAAILAPFSDCLSRGDAALSDIAEAHAKCAEQLAATDAEK